MNKIIKRSIIMVSIIIIFVLILIILLKLKKEEVKEQEIIKEIEIAEQIKVEDLKIEERTYMYLYTNDVLNKIFDYISEKEKNVNNEEALINLLDIEFKTKNDITIQNVLNKLSSYKNVHSYFTKEIYRKDIAQRQNINGRYFYIKGIVRKGGKEEYIYILMKQDLKNSTYSISIMNEQEFSAKGEEKQEITIAENSYNKIYTKKITDYQICLEYFNDYINTIKNNIEDGYKLLNLEYREKRFKNIEEYVSYIKSIETRFKNSILKEYYIKSGEDNKKYICIDQAGNYYIFEQNIMMNYTLILDTYTMDLPEITEEYKLASTNKKVGYNIQKCFEAINNKSYSYVYNKLDEEFKSNNYKTLESFIKAIQNNLFACNVINSSSGLNEGEIYIFNLTITDIQNEEKSKNMTVIMKLKENTDFVMSFSFES